MYFWLCLNKNLKWLAVMTNLMPHIFLFAIYFFFCYFLLKYCSALKFTFSSQLNMQLCVASF